MEKNNPVTTATRETSCKCAKVLLLDDNPVENIVNRKVIETSRFAETSIAFESGYDTLDYLRNESAESLPEFIFLDIMMPKMDGFQFLDEFATLPEAITSRVRVIMLSTSESFQHLNKANKNRFVYRFLNKPLTQEVLAAICV